MEIDFEEFADRAEDVVKSRTFLIAVVLFVAAFAVRWMFHEHGFWIDEGRALMTAKNFLLGHGFGNGNPPLSGGGFMRQHPFVFYTLIAFAYLFFGVKAVAGMVVTNVLASLTVVMVFLTGKELFNEWAGVAAGALMMFSPVHMFFSTRVLTDVPVTFFVALTLYFWSRTETRGETWSFYATFVAAGLTILTKLSGIVVLPALFFYYLWKERADLFLKRRYWYVAGTVIGIFAIWEIRNLLLFGELGIVNVFFKAYLDPSLGGTAGGAGFVEGAIFHLTHLQSTLGIPGAILFLVGTVAAYVYREKSFAIPAVFLSTTFLILSTKALNRYFLPFVPMALVVSGYGADRLRRAASSHNLRAGEAVFALLLLVSAGLMFQSSAAMIQGSADGFTGLAEAGKWIDRNAPEDAKIIAGSGNTIRFFSDRWTMHAGKISNRSEFYRILTERDIDYVEVDRWERTQPQWYLKIVQRSDAFQPVRGFGPRTKPSVMVYRVNQSMLG